MEKIQILGIGRDPVVLQKLLRFINERPDWEGTGTVDDESAIEIFHQRKYDIVLLIDGIGDSSEKKLRSLFSFNNPDLIFIRHEGDSTGLLANEIQESLDQKKSKLNVTDDIFKDQSPE
ncbi:MAG TPA: hypothetical protein VN726_18640 [Hanamia sp.]|nr:hypothetical protein [Hanamia sp.]